jgi:hypothetical protein
VEKGPNLKKEKEFGCSIFSLVIFEIPLILKKSVLSSSVSSVIHIISTSFPLRDG